MNGKAARLLVSLASGVIGAMVVAFFEARFVSASEPSLSSSGILALTLADLALLAPLALVVGAAFGVAGLLLSPGRASWVGQRLAALREQPVLLRSRTAALGPISIFVALFWCVFMASIAREAFAAGSPLLVGAHLALSGVSLLGFLAAAGLATLPFLRRFLAMGGAKSSRCVDPVTTTVVALLVAVVCLAIGVIVGDEGGNGPTPLAIFGVLKRSELDLRPLSHLLGIVVSAWLLSVVLARRFRTLSAVLFSLLILVGALGATAYEARALNSAEAVTRGIERYAPLGRVSLKLLRRVTDRDRDGASPYFGGGDCNDHDPGISPLATDIPGNGIDEDCSGADSPAPTTPAKRPKGPVVAMDSLPPAVPPTAPPHRNFNLVFITVDTLRPNLGFMGYPKPTSPNLDALAARSTVFDHAYSMASYTGKSIGPMMIGKYPSETLRDGGHFNTYRSANVFLAERLQAAGFRTFGAASEGYFQKWSGLLQGIDSWDLSALPATGGGDNDINVTSPQLTDAAIRLLSNSKNTDARFFMWVHYFDPHSSYVPHAGAPDFFTDKGGGSWLKGAYDGEVWFTDKHIGRLLDFLEKQPFAKDTAIVVTADHGEAFLDHGMTYHGQELWESLVRVPLVIYVPGEPPRRVEGKRSHIDMVPTLLELLNQPIPGRDEISGESFLGCVIGEGECEDRDVYLDMPVGPFNGVRRGLIHGLHPMMKLLHFGGKQYQLFNLDEDATEQHDLSGSPQLMAPMMELFQAKRATVKEIYVEPGIN